jgi:hypothetical protein
VQPTFEWMNNLPVSAAIRESIWISPLVNVGHLLALVLLVGALLIVDLKLLGSDEGTSLDKIARDAEPWFIRGFVLMFLTGVPQLISNALREYYSPFFWTKMSMLVLALLFTFTIRRRVVLSPDGAISTGIAEARGRRVDCAVGGSGDSSEAYRTFHISLAARVQ